MSEHANAVMILQHERIIELERQVEVATISARKAEERFREVTETGGQRLAELECELAAVCQERDNLHTQLAASIAEQNRLIDSREEVRKERDAVAAAFDKLGTHHPTCSFCDERKGRLGCDCGLAETRKGARTILDAHDAAKDAEIAALVKALRNLVRQVEISGAVDPFGHPLKNLQALHDARALLAPYECGTCDGSQTVFDSPSAPCPACVTKEVPAQ